MKEKVLTLLVIIFIALSITGLTYSQWNDTITICNTMTFGQLASEIGFVDPLTCMEYHRDATGQLQKGEYEGKDVGKCQCNYEDPVTPDAYKELVINIKNAYPDYEAHCDFTLQNIGTYTVQIVSVTVTDPNGELTWKQDFLDLTHYEGVDVRELVVVNLYIYEESTGEPLKGITLDPGETKLCQLRIMIKQDAEECSTYAFQVEIMSEKV